METNNNKNGSHIPSINYSIIAVNAGIIGAVFIFFAIAAQVPASTIFALDIKKCSFGFDILPQQEQIGVVMVGGMVISLFSVSSVFAFVRRNLEAVIATSSGFAVMFIAAMIIVSSLSCRLPTDFFIYVMAILVLIVHHLNFKWVLIEY